MGISVQGFLSRTCLQKCIEILFNILFIFTMLIMRLKMQILMSKLYLSTINFFSDYRKFMIILHLDLDIHPCLHPDWKFYPPSKKSLVI